MPRLLNAQQHWQSISEHSVYVRYSCTWWYRVSFRRTIGLSQTVLLSACFWSRRRRRRLKRNSRRRPKPLCQPHFTLRAIASGAVYCNRSCLCVCVFVAGGRCPNFTTSSARAVFASLWALFTLQHNQHSHLVISKYSTSLQLPVPCNCAWKS